MNRQDETRYDIVKGLSRLLEHQSFDSVRVNDLCRESGVSRATFYRCFYNISDAVSWLWDECNRQSLYKMGNPYGWREAHILQFSTMMEYRNIFLKAYATSEFPSIALYGRQNILREVTKNLVENHQYVMNEDEAFELEYYIYGCSYMFTKWVIGGMKQSPEYMTDFFGRMIPPFLKDLIGE